MKYKKDIQFYQLQKDAFNSMHRMEKGEVTQEDIETVKMIYEPANDKIGG